MRRIARTQQRKRQTWFRGHYIGVVLDEDPKKRISNYHPTHEIQYGEMAGTLPLKEWLVLPFKHDWDDLSGDKEAREDWVPDGADQ